MRMKTPFRTSFGTTQDRQIGIVRVDGNGAVGMGEIVAAEEPLYNEETIDTAFHVIERHLARRVLGIEFAHPSDLVDTWRSVRRNHMAKAGLETAAWDLWSTLEGVPLWEALGGTKARVPTGVSIGIQSDVPALLQHIEGFLEQGYRRIKIKIEPGWDVDIVKQVRGAFGDIPLTVDGNSAYTLADADHLRELDGFDLMMIEQPLAEDDIIEHARLQARLDTPICLDESILSEEHTRRAIEAGACRIINIKIGRVGGLTESLSIHELCVEHDIPVWCGGMLESGVGRLHNIAIATLPGFTLPGDTSASDRYWEEDVIEPPVTISHDGLVSAHDAPGIAARVDTARLEDFTTWRATLLTGGRLRKSDDPI